MKLALVAVLGILGILAEVYLLMRYEDELASIVEKFHNFALRGKAKR